MKKIIAYSLAIAMTLSLTACGPKEAESPAAEANPVVLKISMAETSTDVKADIIKGFVDSVEQKTDGNIKFEIYYSNELGSLSDVTEQMIMGGNVMAGTSGDFYADYGNKDIMSAALFYVLPTADSVTKLNKSDLFKKWADDIEASSGLKILTCNWAAAPRSVMSTKPIQSANDLKSLKIRVPGAGASAFFEAIGSAPQTGIPFSEVYTNMQQGVIEACEAPLSVLTSYSLQEVAKYVYLSEHSLATSFWAMNADVFNSLSDKDQKILQDEIIAYGDAFSKAGIETQAEYRKTLEDAGVVFVSPSADDITILKEAGKKSFDKFPEMSEGLADQIAEIIK